MTHLRGSFTGIGIAPQVSAVAALSPTIVRCHFSEAMRLDSALTLIANYTLTAAIGSVSRSILSVTPEGVANPTYVDLGLSGRMTQGVTNYTLSVALGQASDLGANTLDPAAHSKTFNGLGLVVGQLDADAVPNTIGNDGGVLVAVTLLDPLADGNYAVYLGPLASALDPACYSGISGQGGIIQVVSNAFAVYVPPLPVGGPYSFYLVGVSGAPIATTVAVITVIAHSFKSRTFSIRKVLPPWWKTGPRDPENERYPQS